MEGPALKHTLAKLGAVDWATDRQAATRETEAILAEAWENRARVIQGIIDSANGGIIPSVRTNEMLSWKLGSLPNGVSVALNEFMDGPNGRKSVNAHEHASELVVLGLKGGYQHTYYKPAKSPLEYEEGEEFSFTQQWSGPESAPGKVASMDLSVVHALDGFEDGTTSLTVFAPRLRARTTVFNLLTGKAEYRYSFRAATESLAARLQKWHDEAIVGGATS